LWFRLYLRNVTNVTRRNTLKLLKQSWRRSERCAALAVGNRKSARESKERRVAKQATTTKELDRLRKAGLRRGAPSP